eukprot:4156587-Amphidinium_carterae.1
MCVLPPFISGNTFDDQVFCLLKVFSSHFCDRVAILCSSVAKRPKRANVSRLETNIGLKRIINANRTREYITGFGCVGVRTKEHTSLHPAGNARESNEQ